MYYYYDKFPRIGTWFIRPQKDNPFHWDLLIDDFPVNTYPSPEKAAEAVADQTTGYNTWDIADNNPSNPHSLSEWTYVP